MIYFNEEAKCATFVLSTVYDAYDNDGPLIHRCGLLHDGPDS
jgi:hypothetical protein